MSIKEQEKHLETLKAQWLKAKQKAAEGYRKLQAEERKELLRLRKAEAMYVFNTFRTKIPDITETVDFVKDKLTKIKDAFKSKETNKNYKVRVSLYYSDVIDVVAKTDANAKDLAREIFTERFFENLIPLDAELNEEIEESVEAE